MKNARCYLLLGGLLVLFAIGAACASCRRHSSRVNYGSALVAVFDAKYAIEKYREEKGWSPFHPSGLNELVDYGLDEREIPLLEMLETTNTTVHDRTMVLRSRDLGDSRYKKAYVLLQSGEVVQLPKAQVVLGSVCPTNAKPALPEQGAF